MFIGSMTESHRATVCVTGANTPPSQTISRNTCLSHSRRAGIVGLVTNTSAAASATWPRNTRILWSLLRPRNPENALKRL